MCDVVGCSLVIFVVLDVRYFLVKDDRGNLVDGLGERLEFDGNVGQVFHHVVKYSGRECLTSTCLS